MLQIITLPKVTVSKYRPNTNALISIIPIQSSMKNVSYFDVVDYFSIILSLWTKHFS